MINRLKYLIKKVNKQLCCYLRPSLETEGFDNSTDARGNGLEVNDVYHVTGFDGYFPLALVGAEIVNPCEPITPPTSPVDYERCGAGISLAFVIGGFGDSGGNGTYRWYLTPTGGSPIIGEYSNQLYNYIVGETTIFYVAIGEEYLASINTPPVDECESERIAVTTTITPTDAITIESEMEAFCANNEITLTFSKEPGSNNYNEYLWKATPQVGSGIPPEGLTTEDAVFTPTVAGTYTISLFARDSVTDCGALTTYSLEVQAAPVINSITYPTSICANGTLNLSVDATGATSYEWYINDVLVGSAQEISVSVFDLSLSEDFEVKVVAIGENTCPSEQIVEIELLALPEAPLNLDSEHCGWQIPTAMVFTGGANGSGVFNWYDDPVEGTLLQSGVSDTYLDYVDATTTFFVSEVGLNGCESERTPVTATVIEADGISLSEDSNTLTKSLGSTFDFTITQLGPNNIYKYTLYADPEFSSGIINGTTIDDATQFSVTPTEPGIYTIRAVGYDEDKNCYAMAELTITVEGDPLIFRMKVSEDENVLSFDETELDIDNNTLNITLLVKDTILNEVRIYGYNYTIFNAELYLNINPATILELELPTVTVILGDNNGNMLSINGSIQKAIFPSLLHFNYDDILKECYAMTLLDIRGIDTALLDGVLVKIKDNIPNAFDDFTLIIPSDRASDLEVGNIQSLGATITTV